MTNPNILDHLLPDDKSWSIRCLVLDIINGRLDVSEEMAKGDQLRHPDDVRFAIRAANSFAGEPYNLEVGESGTLYRCLKYIIWVEKQKMRLIKKGTLRNRVICNNRSLVLKATLPQLLALDGGTSQWATAAYLYGHLDKNDLYTIHEVPNKLLLTMQAKEHWERQRAQHLAWLPVVDKTIERQAHYFITMWTDPQRARAHPFVPQHSEDYCFARAMGFITAEEGYRRWPQLVHHESNRIQAMEWELNRNEGRLVTESTDHRVVQAVLMRAALRGRQKSPLYYETVEKSWPHFLQWLKEVQKLPTKGIR